MHRLFTLTSTLALLLVPAAAQADDLFAVDLAVGRDHACQVTSCGDVECWGRNDHGQAASKDYASGQVMLAGSAPWEEVTVGRLHTCALDGNGRAACWGNNSLGQLNVPYVSLFQPHTFLQIDAGDDHTCGVTINHDVVCWGHNAPDNRLVPPASVKFHSVSAGASHTCGVEKHANPSIDKTRVRCWGSSSSGKTHGGMVTSADTLWNTKFSAVSAGRYHTCALSGSYVHCWGSNSWGQSNDPLEFQVANTAGDVFASVLSGYVDVSAGEWGTCALNHAQSDDPYDAFVQCWGYQMGSGQPLEEPDDGALDLEWGGYAGCMIDPDEQVECWGTDYWGVHDAPALPAECVEPAPLLQPPFPLPAGW